MYFCPRTCGSLDQARFLEASGVSVGQHNSMECKNTLSFLVKGVMIQMTCKIGYIWVLDTIYWWVLAKWIGWSVASKEVLKDYFRSIIKLSGHLKIVGEGFVNLASKAHKRYGKEMAIISIHLEIKIDNTLYSCNKKLIFESKWVPNLVATLFTVEMSKKLCICAQGRAHTGGLTTGRCGLKLFLEIMCETVKM